MDAAALCAFAIPTVDKLLILPPSRRAVPGSQQDTVASIPDCELDRGRLADFDTTNTSTPRQAQMPINVGVRPPIYARQSL